MPTPGEKKPFCTSQGLFLLAPGADARPHLSGERPGQDSSVWEPIARAVLATELTTAGCDRRRLAVIGPVGKTTNLEWLQFRLAGSETGQLPFLFSLKDDALPADIDRFLGKTLYRKFRLLTGKPPSESLVVETLTRYRDRGRITLLLDGLDQAAPKSWQLLLELLQAPEWKACPLAVGARPDAVLARWEKLVEHEARWRLSVHRAARAPAFADACSGGTGGTVTPSFRRPRRS